MCCRAPSVVMLVTDPAHAIPVTIERTGLRTVAYGSRDGGDLSLPNIPMAADVRVGRSPAHLRPGRTFSRRAFRSARSLGCAPAATGMFLDASAEPAADIDRSEDVLLLHDLAEPMGPPAPAPAVGPPRALAPAPAASSPADRRRSAADEQASSGPVLVRRHAVHRAAGDAGAAAGPLQPFKPYWPALVLLYWSLESGDRVTLGLAFLHRACAPTCSTACCWVSRRCD